MDRIEIVSNLTNQGQIHIAFEGNVCSYWVWYEKKKVIILKVKSNDIFSYKKKIQALGKELRLLDYIKTALGMVEQIA